MNLFKQSFNQPIPWFPLSITGIFLASLLLHFWGLGRFNTLVFDEIYYAKFANNYLNHTPFFDAHPPLSKYIIALGIWLGNRLPFGQDTVNNLTGSQLSTFSYRWINALTGSLLTLIVAGLTYQLSHRRIYAVIAALFATVDGLFLVESRYALINLYLIFFGLLGQWFFILALANRSKRWLWLTLAGIALAASFSVKWNGLSFLLTIYALLIIAWVSRWLKPSPSSETSDSRPTPLQNLTEINLFQIILTLVIIPILFYWLIWIPHLQINKISFWELHKEILAYHLKLGGDTIHPYCSRWYTWLLMLRPVAYFYENTNTAGDKLTILPTLPANSQNLIYDVHAMGNPVLWWLSTAAILGLFFWVIKRLIQGEGWLRNSFSASTWIGIYFVVNYASNLLPWVRVTRCTFLYHYMAALIFSELALAWVFAQWLERDRSSFIRSGLPFIALIVLAFIFWLPMYLGLPLSLSEFQRRILLKSWI